MKKSHHRLLFAFLLAAASTGGAQTGVPESVRTLYVSREGSDAWSGALAEPNATRSDGPLATVSAARDVLRQGTPGSAARVLIRGGVYPLAEPLTFTPEDSAAESSRRSYESFPGETAVLAGTRELTGAWQSLGGNVHVLDVRPLPRSAETFRTLFVDGKRATWARFPNQGHLLATGGQGKTVIHLAPGTAKTSWASDPQATVNIIAERGWYNEILRVARVGSAGESIEVVGREAQGIIMAGNPFYVEGVRAELDHEGEWYFDRPAGKLYFYSASSPQGQRIEVAVVDRLIDVRGSVRQPVRNLTFHGLEYFGSDFTVDHVAVRTNQDAAIHLVNAHQVEITDGRFSAVGGYAVWLHLDSRGNVIRRNEVVHAGAGGVLLTGARFSYLSDQDTYDTSPDVQDVAPVGNVIIENHIHHGGVVRAYCSGIHLDSRPLALSQAQGNYVGFNHIHDMPRNGIFAFRNQGGNVFEANHIHDVIQRTNDGGAIHLASMNPRAAPTHMVDNRIYRVGYQGGDTKVNLAFGIYPDWFTSRMVIRGNVISDTRDGAVRLLGGSDTLIADNLLGDDPTASVVFGCWNTHSVSGIVLQNNTIINGVGAWVRYYSDAGGIPRETIAVTPQLVWTSTGNTFWGRNTSGGIMLAKSARPPAQPGDLTFALTDWQKTGSEASSTVRDPGADGVVDVGLQPDQFGLGSDTFRRMQNPRDTADAKRWLGSLEETGSFVAFDDARRVTSTGDWKPEPTRISEFLFLAYLSQSQARTPGATITFSTELAAGSYAVFAKWYGEPADRAKLVEVELTTAGTAAQTVQVDHHQEAHKWIQVGVVEASVGGKATLTLRNIGGGMTAVNAVAWTKLGSD
jgi:hypothetical protein